MSLLMEALRKAEEAKRRMQQEEQLAATSKDARGTPPAPSNSVPAPPGNSSFTLEEREPDVSPQYIRANFTKAQHEAEPQPVTEAPPPQPEPRYARQAALEPAAPALTPREKRAAAASVFAAKQSPARNRRTLTILVIVMVLMIPVGGGVLWYLQSMPSSSIGINPNLASYDVSARSLSDMPPPAEPARPVPPAAESLGTAPGTAPADAPAVAAVADDALAEETAPETRPEPLVAAEAPAPAATPAPGPEIGQTAVPAASPAAPVPPPAAPAQAGAVPDAAPATTSALTVMEISRSNRGSQINPDLMAAYESLQSGDLAAAGRLYQQVLDVVPNNRDALLGLASIDLRQADPAAARERYARLLQLNPRDPLAHTGLLQTLQVTDAAEHERTLKSLMSDYPDVAQLTLALGNLYASQQRWSEAQGAYYNALLTASRGSGGPVHPDYAFNLAVSLEQLNEPKAALDFYRQAKALAAEVTPGFDMQLLNDRLAYLEQAQP